MAVESLVSCKYSGRVTCARVTRGPTKAHTCMDMYRYLLLNPCQFLQLGDIAAKPSLQHDPAVRL